MSDSPGLTFYFRDGCHLCEDMWQQLQELRLERSFQVRRVDVDSAPGLAERFGSLVPVLDAGDELLCHYYLDPAALKKYLDRTEWRILKLNSLVQTS